MSNIAVARKYPNWQQIQLKHYNWEANQNNSLKSKATKVDISSHY